MPVNEAFSAVSTESLVEKKLIDCCVDALLGVGGLHEPRHDDFGRVVGDGEIVGEVLGDLVALLLVLQSAQRLVAFELEPGAVGGLGAGKTSTTLSAAAFSAARSLSSFAVGGLQHFERHNLGLLQRAAKSR